MRIINSQKVTVIYLITSKYSAPNTEQEYKAKWFSSNTPQEHLFLLFFLLKTIHPVAADLRAVNINYFESC